MKKSIKIFLVSAGLFAVNICGISGYYAVNLPDSYYVSTGDELELSTVFSIDAVSGSGTASVSKCVIPQTNKTSLRLFGIFPVKNVEVKTFEQPMLIPGGEPFGIKLLMEGVMIVGTDEVRTSSGMENPAEECGLKKGDIILSANDCEISSNTEFAEIVSHSDGKPITIVYSHNDEKKQTELYPVRSFSDGVYKAGLWVRDSTAGIGTMTFYEASTSRFGGLGHPVCDNDTGDIIPILKGETAEVNINKVVKGKEGAPGELHGCFSSELSSGVIYKNNNYGVFGELFSVDSKSRELPMGLKQDVKKGPAVIRTTIDETGPHEYDIEIIDINYNDDDTKNMTICVTDKELLEKTGGIVQGMSGSPIIQDGKLIGAVTHVLVNDPEKGFGIFCENMYETGFGQ
ncbi:MAG: SpoIVB peptidase [Oscillospiraceae bacterium]|nr:SpoIVB peptidase [Oscillospiraceae bacterium]